MGKNSKLYRWYALIASSIEVNKKSKETERHKRKWVKDVKASLQVNQAKTKWYYREMAESITAEPFRFFKIILQETLQDKKLVIHTTLPSLFADIIAGLY